MRTLKLKVKSVDGPDLPTVTLQHPAAPLGCVLSPSRRECVATILITDIPDEVPTAAVVLAYRDTVNLSWIGRTPRYTFRFAELGAGRILR